MHRMILLLFLGMTTLAAGASEERNERLRCACVEGRLDRVQDELRGGYKAARGKRLKARQKELEDERRRECR